MKLHIRDKNDIYVDILFYLTQEAPEEQFSMYPMNYACIWCLYALFIM